MQTLAPAACGTRVAARLPTLSCGPPGCGPLTQVPGALQRGNGGVPRSLFHTSLYNILTPFSFYSSLIREGRDHCGWSGSRGQRQAQGSARRRSRSCGSARSTLWGMPSRVWQQGLPARRSHTHVLASEGLLRSHPCGAGPARGCLGASPPAVRDPVFRLLVRPPWVDTSKWTAPWTLQPKPLSYGVEESRQRQVHRIQHGE